MKKQQYSSPAIKAIICNTQDLLCASPIINPEGDGHDFGWGYQTYSLDGDPLDE